MPSPRRGWQFTVSPPGDGDGFGFSLSVGALRVLAGSAVLFLALMVTGLAAFSKVLREAGKTKQLAAEVLRLREDNKKIVALARDLDEIRSRERQVRELLGAPLESLSVSQNFGAGGRAEASEAAGVRDERFPRRWPLAGELSRAFSPGPGRRHEGLDIAGRTGTPVRAAGAGTVTFAGSDSVFGNSITIDHGNGYTTLYGHNSRLAVAAGQAVTSGQIIAYVGNTGISSAPHLHFEVRRGGQPLDPTAFLGPVGAQAARSR